MTNRVRVFLIGISSFLLLYVFFGGVLAHTASNNDSTYRDLGVYSEVLSRIQQEYVTTPNLKKVTNGAIRGLLQSLDPYSTYLTPKEYQDYEQHPEAGPGKLGIFLSERSGFATIVDVLPGSPAAKAGIETGDLLDTVNGRPVREASVVQIDRELSGLIGSTVKIGIIHQARGEPRILTLERLALSYPAPAAKLIEGHTAYIHPVTFNKGMAAEIQGELSQLIAGGATRAVLDLRNCAGGHVSEAEKTADLFLDHGLIAYLSGQQFPRQNINAQPVSHPFTLPVAVLINQATAGPAEIVAGAIQANNRGKVVGARSFGVGVYQKLIPVGDGSALLLSVAKYYTPAGRAIQGEGIEPNVVEDRGPEFVPASAKTPSGEAAKPDVQNDPQLKKALEILDQNSAPAKAA